MGINGQILSQLVFDGNDENNNNNNDSNHNECSFIGPLYGINNNNSHRNEFSTSSKQHCPHILLNIFAWHKQQYDGIAFDLTIYF